MQAEDLFEDRRFNDNLIRLAALHRLPFDDYRQEVFLYLVEHAVAPMKAAHRVADKMLYWDRKQKTVPSSAIANRFDPDSDGILWEELHTIA